MFTFQRKGKIRRLHGPPELIGFRCRQEHVFGLGLGCRCRFRCLLWRFFSTRAFVQLYCL